MDLTGIISAAEIQYKQILEDFFRSIYNEKQLPSHGLEHHRRVWNTAKELTLILAGKDLVKDKKFVSSLLLASYLHDIGMAIDHGPRHGRHSLELSRRFLDEHNLDEADFPGMLQAVLDHDNKDYNSPANTSVQSLLSIADDLDAFGFTGIYRYIEIYSLRGISPDLIGRKIRENALKRYLHFKELFNDETYLINTQKCRFEILDDFFTKYEEKLESGELSSGYVTVVTILLGMIKENKDVHETIEENLIHNDPVVTWFFKNLSSSFTRENCY